MIEVIPIPALRDNYIWCITHTENHQCLIVDPGEARPVHDIIKKRQLSPQAILVTHHHPDHCAGIPDLVNTYKLDIYASDKSKIPQCNHPLQDEAQFDFESLGLSFKVYHIPGHTLEHIAFHTGDMIFTGDTLFTGGCGKLFEGTAEQMYHSLQKLKALPPETLVYCGHEYTEKNLHFAKQVEPENEDLLARIQQVHTLRQKNEPTVPATIATELKTNPFLRIEKPRVREAVEKHFNKQLPESVEILAALREWKDTSS